PGACGLASAKGWIQFIDTCMAEHYLKIALVHELAHHVDFSTDPKAVYGVSSRPDWLAFSGWRVEEFIDQNAANIVRRWVYDDKKEGFVTSYATTSPREDWA